MKSKRKKASGKKEKKIPAGVEPASSHQTIKHKSKALVSTKMIVREMSYHLDDGIFREKGKDRVSKGKMREKKKE